MNSGECLVFFLTHSVVVVVLVDLYSASRRASNALYIMEITNKTP